MRFFRACTVAVAMSACTAASIWTINRYYAKHPPIEKFELETRAAKALVEKHPILLPSRINESVLRWSIAEQLEARPQAVLFGSSHGLHVSSETLGRIGLMNFSISGAMLADHLISTEILARRDKRPRIWLVMVDPWLFNPDVDFLTWQARPQEIARFEETLSALQSPPLTLVFGPRVDYFLSGKQRHQYSLDPLFQGFDRFVRKHFDDVFIPDRDFQAIVMVPDGSVQPSIEKQQMSPETVRSLAFRQFLSGGDRHRYGNYSKVDEDLWQLFERWVQFLKQDGGRVYLVLSPYYPAIYPQIIANPQNQLNTIETRVWQSSLRLDVPVIGSYNPATVGVQEQDFYDGDHLRESGLTHLFEDALPQINYQY